MRWLLILLMLTMPACMTVHVEIYGSIGDNSTVIVRMDKTVETQSTLHIPLIPGM